MRETTDLGTIWVTGQRRAPGGSFPSGGAGGGKGDDDGTSPHPVDDQDDGIGDETAFNPCVDPETALEWNADAAAATAAREFVRLAAARRPPEDLNTREWGAFLYRRADGSIRIGAINSGNEYSTAGQGSVRLIHDGPVSDIVGFIHSHKSGNHLPSDGTDQEPGDIQVLDSVIEAVFQAGGSRAVRMYIVAPNQGPANYTPYNQINFYNASNAVLARQSFTPGPKVNPEGTPCPGV